MILARVEKAGCFITDFVEEKPGTEVLATETQYAKWGPRGSAHLAYISNIADPKENESPLSVQLGRKLKSVKKRK